MSYLKDREIWLSSVPTGNPPAGYVWVFIQNGVFVVRDSNGVDKIMASTTGTVTNATSASYVEYSNVADKPALISGSSQVSFDGITDKPALVSSSAQIVGYNVFATTGSNQFNGSQAITGSLTVTGQVVAQTLNVQQVTSSIVYSSGSNIFGNDLGNTQQFTGSVSVTGSLTVNGVNYLPLTGGTLTGALNGTSAAFSGDATVSFSNSTGIFTIGNRSGNNAGIFKFASSTTATNWIISNNAFTANALQFTPSTAGGGDTYTTPALTLSSTGNVGIGTASPDAKLQIVGSFAQQIRFGTNTSVYTNISMGTGFTTFDSIGGDSGAYSFRDDGTTRMFIDSNGNVGIGTASPLAKLDILGNTDTFAGMSKIYLTDVNTNSASRNWSIGNGGSAYGNLTFSVSAAKDGNPSNGTEINAMVITNAGNVGIGTTNPATNLHVVKNSSSPIRMERTGGSAGFVDLALFGAGGSNYFALGGDRIHSGQINDLTTASAANVFIGTDSNGITNVLHRSTSSLKYKIDIRDYDKGLDFIKTLRPVYYKGKTDGDKQFAGLIAEEVHASGLEEFVQYAQDGSPDSLAYTHITALLINGIKELKAKIESLEAENYNLKSRLEVLEQS
jgi:hypothetical protein